MQISYSFGKGDNYVVLYLRCDSAEPTADKNGDISTLICATAVWPDINRAGEYVDVSWDDLPDLLPVAGPVQLTPLSSHAPVLTAAYSSGWIMLDGVMFFLTTTDPAFDPTPVVGGVFAASGEGWEPWRERCFRRPTDACIPERAWHLQVADLGLSSGLATCIEREGISMVGELLIRGADELQEIRDFGPERLQELRTRLTVAGLWLSGEGPADNGVAAEPGAGPDTAR